MGVKFCCMVALNSKTPILPILLLLFSGVGLCGYAATYQVGPSRTYHTVGSLPSLNPGDIVEIDPGTYNEVKRWRNSGNPTNPIVVRGIGATRPLFDATGLTVDGVLPNPRAVFQVEAHYVVLENLEFKNATNGNNGAGIRVTGANNVTVRNCKITKCDMGVMSDNNTNFVFETSEVASNGTSLYDGFSHNFYLGGDSVTVRGCYIHDSLYGQNMKSRAHFTALLYNYIADSQDGEVGLVDETVTGTPNSHAVMIGNIVISKPRLAGYNSARFVQFGQDSGGQHNGTLFAFNNTFVAGDGRIQFLTTNAIGAAVVARNNIFYGSDKIVGTPGAGITGSNNWMQSSAIIPATFFANVQANEPGFVNRTSRNFHLTAASICRNRGLGSLTCMDGVGASQSGLPTLEYLNHQQTRSRLSDGQIDIGAFEYRLPSLSGIQVSNNACAVSFTTEEGNQYDLLRASNLLNSSWSPVLSNIPGTGGIVQVTDTNVGGQTRLFYRLRTPL